MDNKARLPLFLGFLFLFLAVAIGAFGAHGLKNMVTEQLLATFETGVRYQFYHAFSLILLGILRLQLKDKFTVSGAHWSYLIGIILFSFNCYLYVLTGQKIFAMLVPIGGVSFLVGHFLVIKNLIKA